MVSLGEGLKVPSKDGVFEDFVESDVFLTLNLRTTGGIRVTPFQASECAFVSFHNTNSMGR